MYITKMLRRYHHRRRPTKPLGFTLIELLIGMILAFLVMAPMLGFMVNLLEQDKAEQAKATTELEVQAALDYIARDLQQAIYIYDNRRNSSNSSDTITPGKYDFPIKNQIPPVQSAGGCKDVSTCIPILAFWKRQLVQDVEDNKITGVSPCGSGSKSTGVNPYVYSLVVYYYITGAQGASSNTWSNAARIGRFEIRDGVRWSPPPEVPLGTSNDDSCFYYNKNDSTYGVDDGFKLFVLQAGISDLDVNMNSWTKGSGAYTNSVATLVDYIDPSEWLDSSGKSPTCPIDPTSTTGETLSRIPKTTGSEKVYGFYACVNTKLWVAQTFIRGNSLFRSKADCDTSAAKKNQCQYTEQNKNFLPRSTIQVRGQGFLDVQ